MQQRLSTFNRRLLVAAICALMLSNFSPNSVLAQAHDVGYYPNPDQTCQNIVRKTTITGIGLTAAGTITFVAPNPVTAALGVMGVTLDIIAFAANGLCEDLDEGIRDKFVQAYDEALNHGVRPGVASNDVHYWVGGIMIQDFTGVEDSSGNQIGDGWGAIIGDGTEGSDPHFVYGSIWAGYKRAVYEKSVLGGGIDPGYPTSFQHQWNRVVIQDFSGSSWGISAIIGGGEPTAWLVAGNHLQAYIDYDGSNTLGNPLGPVELNADGWYEQKFEDGVILELAGKTKVEFTNESAALAPSGGTVTQPPVQASVSSSDGFHLPWEAGSVWQITSDNNGGNHADQYNQYAFDAVPVADRSTPNVTAIADGRVLGFQADVPNEALFTSGHAGNCMMIEHDDGSISLYAHLAAGSIPGDLRREGAEVRSGMVIGTVGNTGYASGVHLHWSLLSDGFMYNAEGYRTCAGTSIPSQYADNDAELIEDGGVPRTGRYYESFNVPSGGASSVPVQPADPAPATCQDAVRPEQTSRLTASPANADTTTEVMLSVTITNAGCEPFAPTVLAIGGRDPAGNVTDPYQTRDFVLAPGESRTIDVPVVLSSPGTHEFFMAHQSGGWHRIPDTSGDSSSIYVTVTEAAPAAGPTEAPAVATEAPPAPTEVASDPGVIVPVDGAVPDGEVAPMDIGASGPNGHEIGAQFTVSMEDGTFLGSCTLEGDAMAPYPLSCQVDVPRYTTVVVTLDESTITPGLEPVQNPLTFDTSSQPGAASHWGVGFQLEAQSTTTIDSGPVDIAIYTTENGTAAYDACYVLVDHSNIGCDENRDGKVTFAEIPFGTYTVRQTADLGPGRSVTDFTIQVSGKVNAEGYEPFTATIASTDTTTTTITPTGGSSAVPSGSVDIALITRDPDDVSLLRDTCYVLVGYSNQGCDENGDGQVTFADIPYGTYTVSQTRTPAGYPTIDDYVINVEPVTGMPGSGPFGVPLGFIVKQAPEQNAPDTRNVSVVFLDMVTHERVTTGACVELTGASLVGCDEDLVDGQVDFIDVPAGGPYELSFSNLPAGYEVGTVGGPLSVSIDAGSGAPSNRTVFVLVAGGGSGSSVTIEPVDSSASISPQAPVSSVGAVQATVYMTFRGCPEGFIPDVTDPHTACTIPLDAPDAALVGEGGVASSFVPITGLERQYDGAYIFPVNSGGGYALALTGLEPVLRDNFHIFGVDDFDGSSYISQLKNGETREIFVFYYYE